MSKTIKMFAGVKMVTDKGTQFYKDMDILKVLNCPEENFGTELTRALICSFPGYVDLSEFAEGYEVFKLRLLTCDEGEQVEKWEVLA